MGLCKCAKRKVTNLFCFEHDVNVCEDCLVADHERCIVQSYVQWLQDSDYNPICLLCKDLLKEQPTIRLACYDVFHWSCLDKYASELPPNTAPAGYCCPKCKSGIFTPDNIVGPVVNALREKLQTVKWSRVGLGQPMLKVNESFNIVNKELDKQSSSSKEDEANGFVIVSEKKDKKKEAEMAISTTEDSSFAKSESVFTDNNKKKTSHSPTKFNEKPDAYNEKLNTLSHNRTQITENYEIRRNLETSYDPSLGVVLNISNLDRDTGDYKYQRRPVFEWFNRWLKSRSLSHVRITRQKRNLFIVIVIFAVFFTLILIMTRLGEISTENDPVFDPLNNPNIHVE